MLYIQQLYSFAVPEIPPELQTCTCEEPPYGCIWSIDLQGNRLFTSTTIFRGMKTKKDKYKNESIISNHINNVNNAKCPEVSCVVETSLSGRTYSTFDQK